MTENEKQTITLLYGAWRVLRQTFSGDPIDKVPEAVLPIRNRVFSVSLSGTPRDGNYITATDGRRMAFIPQVDGGRLDAGRWEPITHRTGGEFVRVTLERRDDDGHRMPRVSVLENQDLPPEIGSYSYGAWQVDCAVCLNVRYLPEEGIWTVHRRPEANVPLWFVDEEIGYYLLMPIESGKGGKP